MDGLTIRGPEGIWEDYWINLSSFWSELANVEYDIYHPNVDILEGEDAYLLRMGVPGLNESDFKVEHDHDILSISGKWPEISMKDMSLIRRERPVGEFCRRFSIPEDVDQEHIVAKYTNGVLELTLPKMESATKKSVKVEVH